MTHDERTGRTAGPVLVSSLALVAALSLLLAAPASLQAQDMASMDGDRDRWQIRPMGAVVLMSGEVPTLGTTAVGLETENLVTFGVDVTHFVTPRWGVNLLLATASTEVRAVDGTSFGSLDILPPTLTLQYRFLTEGPVRPYLGAGGNLSIFYEETGQLEGAAAEVDPGLGAAVQGGFDFIVDGILIFTDARWVTFLNDPTVETALGNGELDHDMLVLSAGVGFRF